MASTESGWTKEFPVIVGFYFVRTEQYRELPAEFDGRAVSALHGARFFPDDLPHHHPEFLGPFTASDAEQLMELRKLLHSVREACNHRSIEMIGNEVVQLIPQINAVIGEK